MPKDIKKEEKASSEVLEENTNKEVIRDSMKKEDPKEKYHSFKAFARASHIAYGLITFIIVGVVVGYFLDKYFPGHKWMAVSILVFTFLGIADFYRNLLRLK